MGFPEEGELVVGTIIRVEAYGFYVRLDEYDNIEGFISVKEVPSSLARGIMRLFKPRQKVVLKVVYSNPRKLQVDLSLKRVTNDEKRKKLMRYKQETKAARILDIAREYAGIKDDSAARRAIIEKYGSLYDMLEKLAESSGDVIKDFELNKVLGEKTDKYLEKLTELVKERVKPKRVSVTGIIKAYSPTPNGVLILRKVFAESLKKVNRNGMKAEITYIGSPRYRLAIEGDNYRDVERVMAQMIKELERALRKVGHLEFERERRK